MKSIMQQDDGTCYLCMKLNCDYGPKLYTEEHHAIFGTAQKTLSEKYGLKVYLCLQHHREGPQAVHNNYKNARLIQAEAQEAFEKHFPELNFRDIFGKNYK